MLGGKIDRLPGVSPLEFVSKQQEMYSLGEIKAIERNRTGWRTPQKHFQMHSEPTKKHRIGKINSLERQVFLRRFVFKGCEKQGVVVVVVLGVCTLHERQGMVGFAAVRGFPYFKDGILKPAKRTYE